MTWTSRSPAPPTASRRCRWTSRSPVSRPTCCAARSARRKDARLHILGKMAEALAEPRSELSEYAPQVLTIKIESDQIGLLIGKGGETIRGLEEEFEVKIDIEEDGFVRLYASDGVRGQAARDRIDEMTRPISVGDVYTRPARRQDRRLRRVRRGPQGHRRPAARLARRAGPAHRLDRAGARSRRPRERRGHRDRPRARTHRAEAVSARWRATSRSPPR